MDISCAVIEKEDLQNYFDNGYILTDEYEEVMPGKTFYQLAKKINYRVYSVIDYKFENNTFMQSEMTIDLDDYTTEQLDEYAQPYYGSYEMAVKMCGDDVFQIMCECIAETEFAM